MSCCLLAPSSPATPSRRIDAQTRASCALLGCIVHCLSPFLSRSLALSPPYSATPTTPRSSALNIASADGASGSESMHPSGSATAARHATPGPSPASALSLSSAIAPSILFFAPSRRSNVTRRSAVASRASSSATPSARSSVRRCASDIAATARQKYRARRPRALTPAAPSPQRTTARSAAALTARTRPVTMRSRLACESSASSCGGRIRWRPCCMARVCSALSLRRARSSAAT